MKFHGSLFLEKYAPGFRCSIPWLKITNYVRFQFQLLQIYGKSYTRELCLKKWMKGILAVMSTTQLVLKIKPEKNSAGIAGSRIEDHIHDFSFNDKFCHVNYDFHWRTPNCLRNCLFRRQFNINRLNYSERKGNWFFCFLNDKVTFMNQRTV